MENRLPTVFVGLDRLRGQEGGDPGYHELAQALRRLAGRLVHGIASEAERARRERFVVELDVLIGQTLVDLAVDIGRCLQTGAAWGRRHDGRAGVCRPVGGAVRRAPRRLGGDATRSGVRRATCGLRATADRRESHRRGSVARNVRSDRNRRPPGLRPALPQSANVKSAARFPHLCPGRLSTPGRESCGYRTTPLGNSPTARVDSAVPGQRVSRAASRPRSTEVSQLAASRRGGYHSGACEVTHGCRRGNVGRGAP